MPCQLLHLVEQPDPDAYADPDLKDLVGSYPTFYCAYCAPLRPLLASESVRCMERQDPCWKPADRICG